MAYFGPFFLFLLFFLLPLATTTDAFGWTKGPLIFLEWESPPNSLRGWSFHFFLFFDSGFLFPHLCFSYEEFFNQILFLAPLFRCRGRTNVNRLTPPLSPFLNSPFKPPLPEALFVFWTIAFLKVWEFSFRSCFFSFFFDTFPPPPYVSLNIALPAFMYQFFN